MTAGGGRRAPDLDRAARAIDEFLDALGIGTADPELVGSGRRVAEAFSHDLLAGYAMDPALILSEKTACRDGGLVVLRDIAASTTCPHHLLPAIGVVHVGYVPGDAVVGLGALGKLVDCFSRRLVLQEALGQHVADALVQHAGARGAACVVDFAQACSIVRGERRHGSRAVTFAWAGSMASDASERAQMLASLGESAAARNGA